MLTFVKTLPNVRPPPLAGMGPTPAQRPSLVAV